MRERRADTTTENVSTGFEGAQSQSDESSVVKILETRGSSFGRVAKFDAREWERRSISFPPRHLSLDAAASLRSAAFLACSCCSLMIVRSSRSRIVCFLHDQMLANGQGRVRSAQGGSSVRPWQRHAYFAINSRFAVCSTS
jgi:hypothetical protein